MSLPNLARVLLQLRLTFRRCGVDALLAGVLLLAAASLWLALLPSLAARIEQQTRAVTLARTAPPPKPVVTAPAMAAARLAAFYSALGDAAHSEQIVERLFDAAEESGVTLDKAEYKPARDTAGRFETYTIVLPVKGDYARLRRFCERVLLSVPYAALDDMRFKRSSANDATVEASLRLTVFLRPVASPDTGEVRR
ncbi:GspMb/PilO family protein [Paraburkholderia sp. C35]|uniref:GspMb/PilO family protein n=1 Tax=Paraburkholderia sp. C35 TaxID=2126993 RepID=UPI000D68CC18|nr:GspMb/PilO family protein [Paraburkholderia sp. C35]